MQPDAMGSGRPSLALKLLIAVNLGLALAGAGLWLIAARQGLLWRADFTNFYTGWVMLRDGVGARLYDFGLQAEYQQRILEGRSFADGLLPYMNPPHLTFVFLPFAWASLSGAYWLWAAIQLGLLALALRLLLAIDPKTPAPGKALLVAGVLAFPPLTVALMGGSFSLLLLVAQLALFHGLRRGTATQSGLGLLMLTLKPQLAIAPAAVALGGRRWGALAIGAGAGLALALLAVIVLGWPIWPAYLELLLNASSFYGAYGFYPERMYNLRGLLTWSLGSERAVLIGLISNLAFVAVTLATIWLWRGPWHAERADFGLRFALSIAAGLLVTPHLYPHDVVLAVVPAVLLAAQLRSRGAPPLAFLPLALVPLAFRSAEAALGPLLGVRFATLLLLGLTLWIAVELRREQVRSTGT